jgi:GNAT superfamily N-acetyltransferase
VYILNLRRGKMIQFEKARIEDTKALALVSWRAFDNDIHYGAPTPVGPKGYKSDIWQSVLMGKNSYYKMVREYRIIGGFVVLQLGIACYELERMFIEPDFQNQGTGTRAILFMESVFPEARLWRAKTPRWNRRNQHFFEKLGYTQVGFTQPDGLIYEKQIKAAALYH